MNHDVPYHLVDTNVWISSFFPERDGHDDSLAFINAALQKDCRLLHSPTIINDAFYISCAELKRMVRSEKRVLTQADALSVQQTAWGLVNEMNEVSTAVGLDGSDIWKANRWRSVNPDFEDNLIRAATERANADLLVTWDKQLLAKAFVPTVTPTDALKDLGAM